MNLNGSPAIDDEHAARWLGPRHTTREESQEEKYLGLGAEEQTDLSGALDSRCSMKIKDRYFRL
jgi:hypothetical protein